MTLCDWCEERFDDFIEGDLCAEDEAIFSRHLEYCSTCKSAIDAQRIFAESAIQMRQRFDEQYETTFRTTHRRVRRAIRVRQCVCVLPVAAVLVLCSLVAWNQVSSRQERTIVHEPAPEPTVTEQLATIDSDVKNQVQIEIEDYVAVPVKNSNPNITIFWLHPTHNSADAETNDDSTSINPQEALFASNSR